jgi:patatin-like phospholipase/acyl hydrolase
MHQVHSTSIFTPNRWHFAGLFGSRYTDKGIRKVAETLFGNRTLGDLDRKVLIPAFDLNHYKMNGQRRWTPKFFHNFGESPDLVVRAADVARYTSAAPTYFPIADGYIDGGVVCNNPSIPAISRVLDSRTGVPGVTLDDIVVLSLGTGRAQSYIDSLNGKWGKIQWSDRFIEMMMDGANDASHKECQRLLGPRYIRIDPTLSANIPLDGHDRLDEIMRISDEISLNPAISWAKLQWPKEA